MGGKKDGWNKNSEDEGVYVMKEPVLQSRSIILLQAELILAGLPMQQTPGGNH